MTRLPAILVVIVAAAAIVFGRVTRVLPIAIVGYLLIVVALVLLLISRR